MSKNLGILVALSMGAFFVSSCSVKKTTTTTVTEKVDTLISIPPSIYKDEILVNDLITKPRVIENDEVKVTLEYTPESGKIEVEAEVKKKEVEVKIDREVTTVETIKKPASLSRIRWFCYGAAFILIILCLIKFRGWFIPSPRL